MSLFFLCLTWVGFGFAQSQDTTQTPVDLAGEIKAAVQVDRKQVPQNRTVTYTIEITWNGDLDRFEIENLETPVLSNLEIVGNSSSDKVGQADGKKQAIKKYEFVLKPIELGMAYIDGSIVEYKDVVEDKTRRLVTNRLEVKVVDAIIERDDTFWAIAGAGVLLLFGIVGLIVITTKRKREREAELRQQEKSLIPIEEKYLSEIKRTVDLQSQDAVSSFSSLSKLFRRYLSERYQIPAVENTTKEITTNMNNLAISEKIIEQAEEVLHTCDVAKFSGGQTEAGVLERAYTLVEEILNKNKSDYIELNQN